MMQERKTIYSGSLSIRTYALLVIIIAIILFGGYSWLALDQLERIERGATKQTHEYAKEEVTATLSQLNEAAQLHAEQFSKWDETVQQLSTPTYYGYWRDSRAKQASFSPSYLVAIELYNIEGKILADSPHTDMPEYLNNNDLTNKTTAYANQRYLYYQSPIIDDLKNQHVAGYVIIKLDLIAALKIFQKFKYVNLDTISITTFNDKKVRLKDLETHLKYDVLPNHEFNRSQEHMVDTLKKLGYLAGLLGIIFLYLLVKIVALPLSKLSTYIDVLKSRDILDPKKVLYDPLTVLEFLKIRESITSYHEKLSSITAALQKSETHKQAILDNVADGIITINGKGEIESYNPAASIIFDYHDKSLLNREFISLLKGSSQHLYTDLLEECKRTNNSNRNIITSSELVAYRKDGRSVPIEMAISKMSMDDSLIYIAVVRDISERKLAEQKLRFLANYDTLTKLPNRTLLKDRIQHAMMRADREERLIGILFLDLDRFKTINDTLGHHAGDSLLKAVSKRLTEHTRESDTVARLGGDEFTIVMESISHVDEALKMAEKLCDIFSEPFHVLDQNVFVSTSVGVTIYPFDDTDTDNLLKDADIAMYRAKENGGNTYAFYEPDMDANATTWLTLENNLRNALSNDEFFLVYQPRISFNNGQVVGAEALLRWQHPEHGLISPVDFIPMLEETGLIVSVGEWVLRTASNQNVEWQQSGLPPLRMSVNLSPRQFKHDDLISTIKSTLDLTKLSPKWLELEITESMLVDNVSVATKTLKSAHDLGIHISVDDFGTGYSSLSYLKRFSIDTLKIDRAFVKDITTDSDDAAIASAIVALARSMNLSITAEGVENENQLDYLKQLGCDEAQGFLFSKPMKNDDFIKWLKQYNNESDNVERGHFPEKGN